MLKTLDVLIGATTVVLLFSLAVTVIHASAHQFGRQARTILAERFGRPAGTVRSSCW